MKRLDSLGADLGARLAGCPEADRLRRHLEEPLDSPERTDLDAHLVRCAACRAAVESLRAGAGAEHTIPSIDPPPDAAERLDRLVEAISRGGGKRAAALGGRGALRMAAGLVLAGSLATTGYLWWAGREPAGQESYQDLGEMRGGGPLEPLEPVGTLSRAPATMRWAPHPEAASYVVVVFDASMRKVWTRETPRADPSLALDEEAIASLAAAGGGPFTWQVVAVGRLGQDLGRSPAARFVVSLPAPGE